MDNTIKSIPILILAGGKGTRLGAYTKDIPKPMIDINGQPFLDYLIKKLQRQGAHEIFISAGYKKYVIINHFLKSSVSIIEESSPLGTGGAIRNALEMINAPFILVLNGDTLFDIDLQDFIRKSLPLLKDNIQISIACLYTSKLGNVSYRSAPFIKFHSDPNSTPPLMNGGIYLIKQEMRNALPLEPFSFETNYLAVCENLIGFDYPNFFLDIGTPQEYEKAKILLSD